MEHLIALAVVTAVLVMIPGPNVAVILSSSLKHGTRYGLVTVAGTTTGIGLQLVFVVLGLAAILEITANVLTWIRWIGVAYLIYLGIRTWLEPAADSGRMQLRREPMRRLFWRGLLVAVINPKLLIFNAAFLPQFVAPGGNYGLQLALTAFVYLLVMALGDSVWAGFAGLLRPYVARFNQLQNKITGGLFVTAGVGLALAREK